MFYSFSVLPYACGHQQCWPVTSAVSTSSASFATSRELGDHCKIAHNDDISGDGRLFRCGLHGCGKSWKSINGLQYHLQMCVRQILSLSNIVLMPEISSKAHFQQALSSAKFSLLSPVDGSREPSVPRAVELPSNIQAIAKQKNKKVHPCPHHNCPNVYKQLSGLRYHLAHVRISWLFICSLHSF